jgi:hypothetical protein
MAQDIEVKVKVITDEAVNNVNKLGDAFDSTAKDAVDAKNTFAKAGNGVQVEQSITGLKQLKRQLKDTAVGSDEFKKLYQDIDDLEDKLKSAKNTSSDWVDSLENAGGPLGMLGAGLNKAKVSTQSFGGALKATGIGIVVALVSGLVAAFSENETAMKKMQPLLDGLKKIFQGVFRAVEPLFNTMVDLATSALPYVAKGVGTVYSAMMAYFAFLKNAGGGALDILEGIFTLDGDKISSGMDKVKGSFGKATDSFKDSMKAFNAGTKELTKSEKDALKEIADAKKIASEKEAERKRKELEKEKERIAKEKELRKQANDELIALEEKKFEELRDLKAKTDKEKLDLQYQRDLDEINLLAEKGKNTTNLRLDLDKIYEIKRAELKDKTDKEDEAKEKEKEDKAKEDKLLGIQLDLDNEAISFDEKKQRITDRETILLNDNLLTENQRTKIKSDATNARMQLEDIEAKQKEDLLKSISASMDAVADVIGKNTTAGKALSLASALINTYQGISAGVALGYPQSIPAVIMAAATGFKAVKSILGVKVPGKSGGGSISAPTGISLPSAVPITPSVVAESVPNQIASSLTSTPVKAYVVGSDVSSQQSLDRNRVGTASLG